MKIIPIIIFQTLPVKANSLIGCTISKIPAVSKTIALKKKAAKVMIWGIIMNTIIYTKPTQAPMAKANNAIGNIRTLLNLASIAGSFQNELAIAGSVGSQTPPKLLMIPAVLYELMIPAHPEPAAQLSVYPVLGHDDTQYRYMVGLVGLRK